ncbi:hypothetical protein BGW36DRAFT_400182 [Talaromyces proteolyticus]|uniref:BZIP domain-containing protein n=1 Tax=Talaromyces proteolyticus TaxID=1131652 RepID=A0AAD4PW37_9EURO|nr:uncharacterized protein BGW36DRAFT_400182 [Talaromyces proteolyticus]KAH8692083.1 hypothetical protein BGW36DRAFT_400182 [Talaromyces proteolyticus]
MGFLKILGGVQKKTTRDGQPAKRRGPKPDSKPALTRRQELNRQAQRTHRERKEQYIRALEAEYSRLRETYGVEINNSRQQLQQQHDALQQLKDENDQLKEILKSYNISFEPELERRKAALAARKGSISTTNPYTASTAGSQSTGFPSQPTFLTTPPSSLSSPLSPRSGGERIGSRGEPPASYNYGNTGYHATPSQGSHEFSGKVDNASAVSPYPGIFDEDPQLGIDFILQLEAPCRVHTEYLCRESHKDVEKESFFSGHALMASCPPPSHIETVPEGNDYPHQTYDLPTPDLEKLLNLSKQLITDGQITPIMVLQSLKNHEQYRSLTRDDVKTIIETLNAKIRCYGFGAVIEDFELRDCLQAVLGTKLYYGRTPPSRVTEDAVMYA